MINPTDRFVECSVVMSTTEKPSVIKKVGDRIELCERSKSGFNYKVEFSMRTDNGDCIIASTEPLPGIVPIGNDFIWKFCEDINISSVNVLVDYEGKPKVNNGSVVVSPVVKKFGVSNLQEAFDAGRRHTYDGDQWDFDFENFNDWYTKKGRK